MAADHGPSHARINWPADLDEARFLAQYWQQRPLLIRQALPGFLTPLPAEELAGLSLDADTTPRLITRHAHAEYHLEHGPFEAERFRQLTGNDWSLLVTDVEKHLPDLALWLRVFTFLPGWRIDDLMVSYAPVGASVGAHVDEYDVFLLQASGKRCWSIDARAGADTALDPDSELKLLAAFDATDTWELIAGDLLYLPPGVPHHGVASEEPCTTWSIGFKAPVVADMVMRMAEMICEAMPHERFTDGPLEVAMPGEISSDALQRIAAIWQRAVTLDQHELATLSGRLLTESGGSTHGSLLPGSSGREFTDDEHRRDNEQAHEGENGSDAEQLGDSPNASTTDTFWLQIAPFSRGAWISTIHDDRVQLFVDGEVYQCSRQLAMELCIPGQAVTHSNAHYTDEDRTLLQQLLITGVLIPAGHCPAGVQ